MLNKSTKIFLVIFIVLSVIGFFLLNKKDANKENDIDEIVQILDDKSCGFTLISPKEGDTVGLEFMVEGIVDNTKIQERGCGWTVFEAQAGIVHIYDSTGFSVGSALLTTSQDWMTPNPVNYEAKIKIDLNPSDEKLLMVIEEDDTSGSGQNEFLEIPLIFKK